MRAIFESELPPSETQPQIVVPCLRRGIGGLAAESYICGRCGISAPDVFKVEGIDPVDQYTGATFSGACGAQEGISENDRLGRQSGPLTENQLSQLEDATPDTLLRIGQAAMIRGNTAIVDQVLALAAAIQKRLASEDVIIMPPNAYGVISLMLDTDRRGISRSGPPGSRDR